MPIIKQSIIGLIIIIGLLVQTTNAHAIWSPTISKNVGAIRQNVTSAQLIDMRKIA